MPMPEEYMIARIAFILVVAISCISCLSVRAEVKKQLSPDAEASINNKLQKSSSKDLLVFSSKGSLKAVVPVNSDKLNGYKSLSDLLNSRDSPVSTCKNPTPTRPPGCVICDDGHPVCTKAMQKGSLSPQ
jgi:hypothetical protein